MQEKIDLLGRARGFLNPLRWDEPFGMVTIEAMACGCPVISFARGAAPELIVDGQTGFLVQGVDEMARCIRRLGEIDRRATRRHVAEHFSARHGGEVHASVPARHWREPGRLATCRCVSGKREAASSTYL